MSALVYSKFHLNVHPPYFSLPNWGCLVYSWCRCIKGSTRSDAHAGDSKGDDDDGKGNDCDVREDDGYGKSADADVKGDDADGKGDDSVN